LPDQQVKVEEDTGIKALLKSASQPSKCGPKPRISQAQINQLIDYVANHNMSVSGASRKVNISASSGLIHYNVYKNGPEKKIPSPRNQHLHPQKYYMQEQIENLIKYITQDKMTVKEASAKVNLTYNSCRYYYAKYLEDPNRNIPMPQFHQTYTQDQREAFIHYVINDKMSMRAASKKAKMNPGTAKDYYRKYFKQQNPDVATPIHIATHKCYTQEQIKEVIGYIVDDKMTIKDASRKANFNETSARIYYQHYLMDNNIEHPVTQITKNYTQDEITQFIRYVVDDKMTIRAASKKANMHEFIGSKYYRRYLKDHNIFLRPPKCAQDQIDQFIRYIVDDKMPITAASKKANMSLRTGNKYYRQYLKDHNLDMPIPITYTQCQQNKFISYIVDSKMPIKEAAKKANVSRSTGYRYYHQYLDDQKPDAST
jgi:transposase